VGIVDTLVVSKTVDWHAVMAVAGETVTSPHGRSAFATSVLDSVPIRKKRAAGGAGAPAEPNYDDAVDNEVLENSLQTDEEARHGMTAVYHQLFGHPFADAHRAEADVRALGEIVRAPQFWAKIAGQSVVMAWSWMKQHADKLYDDHLIGVRGWRLEDYPACVHGPRYPTAVADARQADGWGVDFSCRQYGCDVDRQGSHPAFVPPPPPPPVNGEAGACTCKGKCATKACPCKAAKATCAEGCHATKKSACNNQIGAEPAPSKKQKKIEEPESE